MADGNSSVGRVDSSRGTGTHESLQDIANKYHLDSDPTKWSTDNWKNLSADDRNQVIQDIDDLINKGQIDSSAGQKAEEEARQANSAPQPA